MLEEPMARDSCSQRGLGREWASVGNKESLQMPSECDEQMRGLKEPKSRVPGAGCSPGLE